MADEHPLIAFERHLAIRLPAAYRAYIAAHPEENSFDLAYLYALDHLAEAYRQHQIGTYAPGWLAVGNDSGDRVVLIRLDDDLSVPCSVDAGDMQPDHFVPLSTNWDAWYGLGCPFADEPEPTHVRVIARWATAPGIREIAALRQCLPRFSGRSISSLREEFRNPGEYVLETTFDHLARRIQVQARELGLTLDVD
jgi:hypothetical protein